MTYRNGRCNQSAKSAAPRAQTSRGDRPFRWSDLLRRRRQRCRGRASPACVESPVRSGSVRNPKLPAEEVTPGHLEREGSAAVPGDPTTPPRSSPSDKDLRDSWETRAPQPSTPPKSSVSNAYRIAGNSTDSGSHSPWPRHGSRFDTPIAFRILGGRRETAGFTNTSPSEEHSGERGSRRRDSRTCHDMVEYLIVPYEAPSRRAAWWNREAMTRSMFPVGSWPAPIGQRATRTKLGLRR